MRHFSTEDTKKQNVSGVILYLSSCKHIFVAFFILNFSTYFLLRMGRDCRWAFITWFYFVLLKSA